MRDSTLLICVNAGDGPAAQTLPAVRWGRVWTLVLDTAAADEPPTTRYPAGGTVVVDGCSIVVLERRPDGEDDGA